MMAVLHSAGVRTLTDHKLNGLNDAINVLALDDPGVGGASHVYRLDLVSAPDGPGITAAESHLEIRFQEGPVHEAGVNGVSGEALLTVLIDRLRGFQTGQFACRENAVALTHLETALMWLQKRTRDRLARGVEGTLRK